MRSGLATTPRTRRSSGHRRRTSERVWQPDELLAMAFSTADVRAGNGLALLEHQLHPARSGHRAAHRASRSPSSSRSACSSPLGHRRHGRCPTPDDASMPEPFAHGYQYGDAEQSGGPDPALPPDRAAGGRRRDAAAGRLERHQPIVGLDGGFGDLHRRRSRRVRRSPRRRRVARHPRCSRTRLQSIQPVDPVQTASGLRLRA